MASGMTTDVIPPWLTPCAFLGIAYGVSCVSMGNGAFQVFISVDARQVNLYSLLNAANRNALRLSGNFAATFYGRSIDA